jgi:hypothetical protein
MTDALGLEPDHLLAKRLGVSLAEPAPSTAVPGLEVRKWEGRFGCWVVFHAISGKPVVTETAGHCFSKNAPSFGYFHRKRDAIAGMLSLSGLVDWMSRDMGTYEGVALKQEVGRRYAASLKAVES